MKKAMVLLSMFFWMEAAASGQDSPLTAPKFPVEIMEKAADPVGGQLANEVKEHIQESTTMRLSYENEDRLLVVIITMDPDTETDGGGLRTIYSVAITWINLEKAFPFYLSGNVGHCGAMLISDCAERITARIYEQIERVVKNNDRESRSSKRQADFPGKTTGTQREVDDT